MGESVVDAPKVENKMGESGAMDVGALHVSVSFGRFENDSLCWEKWSAFPANNKYLEEVEKFSTPGSVAQKKAYFEAHYRRIAERKAELVDQEKKNGGDSVDSEHLNQWDSGNSKVVEAIDHAKSNGHSSSNGVEQAIMETLEKNVRNDHDNGIDVNGEASYLRTESGSSVAIEPSVDSSAVEPSIDSALVEPPNASVIVEPLKASEIDAPPIASLITESSIELDTTSESEDLLPPTVDANVELHGYLDNLNLSEAEEVFLVKEDAPSSGSLEQLDNASSIEATPGATTTSGQRVHSEWSKKTEKVTSVKKANHISSTKRKQTAPAVRSPVGSTPKPQKPAVARPVSSSTKRSSEKKTGLTPVTSKKSAPAASRTVAAPSLHMSLNLDSSNSDPGLLATTRKSLIMERMGDKDIIKRAFRTFQNNLGEVSFPSLAKSSSTQQLPCKETERKTWASTTPQRSNGRTGDSNKKTFSGQQSIRKTPTSPGSLLKATSSGKSSSTFSPSFGTRSHDRGEKLKGFTKKPGEDISAKDTERTLLNSKIKAQKDVELKKLQQSLNFKAKPLPAFYRGSGVAKSSAHKKDVKSEWSG
ncbi:WVD2-like 7-like protein [Drosera capensis]